MPVELRTSIAKPQLNVMPMIESEVFFSRELKVSGDGGITFKRILIEVGFPKYGQDGDVSCVVQMAGIADGIRTIYGVDKFQALELAIKFVNTFLRDPPPGLQIYWPDGVPYK